MYGKTRRVRHLTLDLLWKPVGRTLRFILFETPRGKIILMTSDLHIHPVTALQLYARRVAIETMFDSLKNTLGASRYRFWSKFLGPTSRRPLKRGSDSPTSSQPLQTQTTFDAIEKFMNVQLVVLGVLQLLARNLPLHVRQQARCWLRTTTSHTPSEMVSRIALANTLTRNLHRLHDDPITQIIHEKQDSPAFSESSAQTGS